MMEGISHIWLAWTTRLRQADKPKKMIPYYFHDMYVYKTACMYVCTFKFFHYIHNITHTNIP